MLAAWERSCVKRELNGGVCAVAQGDCKMFRSASALLKSGPDTKQVGKGIALRMKAYSAQVIQGPNPGPPTSLRVSFFSIA